MLLRREAHMSALNNTPQRSKHSRQVFFKFCFGAEQHSAEEQTFPPSVFFNSAPQRSKHSDSEHHSAEEQAFPPSVFLILPRREASTPIVNTIPQRNTPQRSQHSRQVFFLNSAPQRSKHSDREPQSAEEPAFLPSAFF